MPPALLSALANRSLLDAASNASSAVNSTLHGDGLYVICAWPVSGQYGPGSRFLFVQITPLPVPTDASARLNRLTSMVPRYYALVAACVFARKADWLRGACLAGALIIPAVAALHGILLAIMHIPGAVDMDIYGAFQACCIGVLAAPITVKLSKTYFNDPGRNTIFMWTLLLLGARDADSTKGLLSLTVEFYRVSPTKCNLFDKDHNPIIDASDFPYREGSMCGLQCEVGKGPTSSMRTGAVNNIYVIPTPKPLTTGTATLLAAACCVPAILLLVSMWNTILERNWESRFGRKEEGLDDIIEGTNAATIRKMRLVNERIGSFLGLIQALVFGSAVLAILILGEINFFSPQTKYQTEPIESIGQWGPLAGAALAALGSLYAWSMQDPEPAKEGSPSPENMHHCTCTHHHDNGSNLSSRGSTENDGVHDAVRVFESPALDQTVFPDLEHAISPPQMEEVRKRATLPPSTYSPQAHGTRDRATSFSSERGRSPVPSPTNNDASEREDAGGRLKIASKLARLSEKLGTAEKGLFDDSDFREGEASFYPTVPGEEWRNAALQSTEERYQATRDLEQTERRSRSRAPSFAGSVASGIDDDGTSMSRAVSPSPSVSRPRRSSTLGYQSSAPRRSVTSPGSPPIPERSSTLTVPGQIHHHGSTRQRSSPGSGALFISVPEADFAEQSPISPETPAIIVSADPETITSTDGLAESPTSAGPSRPVLKEFPH
ncbi:hypothetical protein V8F06_010097 [Rhypophila decipiens]